MKTNAMRLLDRDKIKYEVIEYDIPKEEFTGLKVAQELNMNPKSMYKTLALKNNHDIYICVIAVDDELDLKKCAKEIGVKNLEMVHVKDLLKEVGYQRGSVSPIGVKKNSGIYFDDEVMNHEKIEVSGGTFGVSLIIERDVLLKYLNSEVKDLVK